MANPGGLRVALSLSAPNFAGIQLAPQFQNITLELISARLYKFSLPLNFEIRLKHTTLQQRDGLILILMDSQGHVGLGEISPLPGFSRETLETAIYRTSMLVDRIIKHGHFSAQSNHGRKVIWEHKAAPSVIHFGVETALLSLLANERKLSLGTMLYGHSSAKIPVSGLIQSALSDWVPEAEYLTKEGYKTLKIKVGRIDPHLEARGIQDIRDHVGPEIKIRLDANRTWNMETAIGFGKAVAHLDIEFIEEPLRDPTQLPRFFDATGVHFAFDETLHGIIDPNISLEAYTGLKAFVLKPTLIGCTARLVTLINLAREQGILPVISSSFESDVGLAVLSQLAASVSGEEIAVGLDTRSSFAAGTTKSPSTVINGWMPVRTLTTQDLDLSHCEIVYEN